MALPFYLALTAAEMAGSPTLPPRLAWMACHFSPCSPGLSNLPETLPPGAMLILDDSAPMAEHDPDLILKQLSAQIERHQCGSVLLDFQRPGLPGQEDLAKLLSEKLPCPVGISELYAAYASCPVFLPPVPPDRPLSEYLTPWQGRKIWLEAALDGITLTLSEDGCTSAPLIAFPDQGQQDTRLHCHYIVESPATFHLWRTRQNLDTLLEETERLGVTNVIGLWQELGQT